MRYLIILLTVILILYLIDYYEINDILVEEVEMKKIQYILIFSVILMFSCSIFSSPDDEEPEIILEPVIGSSTPSNLAKGISLLPKIVWEDERGEWYDIYFGTESIPPLVRTGARYKYYKPDTLDRNTKYYWRIIAYNDCGSDTSEIWEFTTTTLISLGTNDEGYQEYLNEADSSILIYVPEGMFCMTIMSLYPDGFDVWLSGYYIGKYEITNKQYKKFCDETGTAYPPDPDFYTLSNYFIDYPDYPVVAINWYRARDYCTWAGLILPTHAQWEKASRGGNNIRKYPWGDSPPYNNPVFYCNFYPNEYGLTRNDDGYYYTSPVDEFPQGKSPYGCYNMSGNVSEWCKDRYVPYYDYTGGILYNPEGDPEETSKNASGGNWNSDTTRITCTSLSEPDGFTSMNDIGFRSAYKE